MNIHNPQEVCRYLDIYTIQIHCSIKLKTTKLLFFGAFQFVPSQTEPLKVDPVEKSSKTIYLMSRLRELVRHPPPYVRRHLRQLVQLGREAGDAEGSVAWELFHPATAAAGGLPW